MVISINGTEFKNVVDVALNHSSNDPFVIKVLITFQDGARIVILHNDLSQISISSSVK